MASSSTNKAAVVVKTNEVALCPKCYQKQVSPMAVVKHLRRNCPGVKQTKKKVYKGGSKTKAAAAAPAP